MDLRSRGNGDFDVWRVIFGVRVFGISIKAGGSRGVR